MHSWVLGNSSTNTTLNSFASSNRTGRAEKQKLFSRSKWSFTRGVCILFAFLILFSGFTLVRAFASNGEVSPATAAEIVISVDSGDTLWTLALTYKKPSMDTREAVHSLMKRNGLSSSTLISGQNIIVPARMLSE